MPAIFETDAAQHVCPYNEFRPCLGQTCMAWSWLGAREDRCDTDNLVEIEDGPRPAGVPRAPDGEGWTMDGPSYQKSYNRSKKDGLPPATGQRWVKPRAVVRGQCSRNGGDHEYGSGW